MASRQSEDPIMGRLYLYWSCRSELWRTAKEDHVLCLAEDAHMTKHSASRELVKGGCVTQPMSLLSPQSPRQVVD